MADAKDALVHSSAVYLYLYDAKQGQYAQQTDSVVGFALLASPQGETFSLLFYNSQTKQPVLQTPLTPTMRFTPQQNNYVNFYDSSQQNYSMRFKDAAASTAFLRAVVFAKAQAFVQDGTNYQDTSRAFVTLADDLETGKESSSGGVMTGDVVGLAWTTWHGSLSTNANFFTQNPTDIAQRTPTERITVDGELRRIVLGDANGDTLERALSEALIGMNKHAKRVVAAVYPTSQQWFIGEIELVKVKKMKAGQSAPTATTAPASNNSAQEDEANSSHDDLVSRMAALSRAGSQTSGLMASLNARNSLKSPERRQSSFNSEDRRRTSFTGSQTALESAIANPGMVPVPLPGFVTTPSSSRRSSKNTSEQSAASPQQSPAGAPAAQVPQPQPESLAARVLSAPFQREEPQAPILPRPSPLDSPAFTSPEMEKLMKEQSELDDLRRKLEESKRRLEQQHNEPVSSSSFSSALAISTPPYAPPSQPKSPTSSLTNGITPWQPPAASSTPGLPPFSSNLPLSFSSSIGSSSLPSFTSTSLIPSPIPPPLPVSVPPFGARPASQSSSSPEMENNIIRLQRTSTTIETSLNDLHSKMDRLLNLQNAIKPSKYTPHSTSGGYYSSTLSTSSVSSSSGTSSSATLLKNLEKALAQRDQLQELNSRLQDAKDHMESTIEEQQNQLEALQLENRTLFEKSQSGNHMQQEKFRLELRSVQQQLSQTQEQMLAYQEENFRLRQELGAKDDQVAKERAQVQEDARKQLEHLQRQLQVQIQEDSKETFTRLQADKLRADKQLSELSAQKTQVELERDALASQLRSLQSQWADEKANSQAQQDSKAKTLQTQLEQVTTELLGLKQQLDKYRAENRQLQDVVASKEQQMINLQEAKTKQEYAALSELLKEFMNDIYFHFQDAFEEDAEFTGKEIVMAIRKILKQNTMEILSKLEEFWQQQHTDA